MLGGCAAPAPSLSSRPELQASDPARFGIPETIGQWQLRTTVEPITSDSPVGAMIAEAGGDAATATDVTVHVSGGPDTFAFDTLRVPGVTLEAFAPAAAQRIAAFGATQRSEISVAGWKVVRYATPADWAGPPEVFFFTFRQGVIYTFRGVTEEQLSALLTGLT